MKLHHAVSSIFIAWLLIAPPIRGDAVKLQAPLAEWDLEGRYNSATECREAKDEETNAVVSSQTGWSVSSGNAEKRATTKAIQAEKCVVSNDPRLREK